MASREERDLGVASLAGAGIALALARVNPANRALWHAAALGLGAYGAWKLGTAGFEGFTESLAGLPGRLLARFRSEPPPPESSSAVAPNPPSAAPNPNATHRGPAVVGRFLDPSDGATLDVSPWASSYPVLLEIQNTGGETLEGPVELELYETPRFAAGGSWTQVGAVRFRLAPGERRLVTINAQTRSRWSPSVYVRATARFAGHWVTTAGWTLE